MNPEPRRTEGVEAAPRRPLALYLSIAGSVVLPALALVLAAAFGNSTGFAASALCLALGVLSVIGAIVLAIVALFKRAEDRKRTLVGLALGIVGLPVLAVSAVFSILLTSNALHGRPHRVAGIPRQTRSRAGNDWSNGGPLPVLSGLDTETREALARAWLADASLEHASITAFSVLSLDLVALGAPPELIARSHQAALDEVAHARDCFALASAYAGKPLTAAPFPDAHAPRPEETAEERLRRVALETAFDGCIGEGAAAALAAEMSRSASDPVVADVLARIARDEGSHADLAWAILSWCQEVGGRPVRDAVVDALAREPATTHVSPPEVDRTNHGRAGEAHWYAARRSMRAGLARRLGAPAEAESTKADRSHSKVGGSLGISSGTAPP